MSMVQELIAAVGSAEWQIDDQLGKLTSYRLRVDEVTRRVEAALAGSSQDYSMRMIQQLSVTGEQVDQTIAALQGAKDKLSNVRMV